MKRKSNELTSSNDQNQENMKEEILRLEDYLGRFRRKPPSKKEKNNASKIKICIKDQVSIEKKFFNLPFGRSVCFG